MSVLPTGTVTLLFSDMEGSTVLLSRLGSAYIDALDGQRQVLRKAWASHGGTELGTEGDSFFVVFSTAERAVAAAVQAQRDLAAYEWPGGESVRVRMGIHTGTPLVHDGGYVGMDVHRAARIAGAAHGGQVVVSSATGELVAGCLPDGVVLRDLGRHQLKDIVQVEHLFQVAIEGLPQEFPALKTLGAATRLPRPATPLVGRDGELAEVTAVLSSPKVRVVTLTGPGGSGKTRLAIAVAHRLVPTFPDGVYFVALAAVSSPDAMWSSIAEALDVPREARTPPALFPHVAHRRALLVLDNLEQLTGADGVVADLLDAAPSIRVLATSRRPLHVPGEQEHPVPPLELPDGSEVDEGSASGAVQMFVQQARLVRPDFAVTADNAADVAAVCRRLDGLPLAIELAAARTKLLSPAALLTRLDRALDIAATGSRGPTRQKTLRDTIAWSYDLLTSAQQAFFRRLGAFAGGADMDAITAVTVDSIEGVDPLELVAELVDASLVTVGEDAESEPRVGLLETVRAFALDQLHANGEVAAVRERHALHYVSWTEQLRPALLSGAAAIHLQVRSRLVAEHDNLAAALGWALGPDAADASVPERVSVALSICAALCPEETNFWADAGYVEEGRWWLERAVSLASEESQEKAQCLLGIASLARIQGDADRARSATADCVAMCRRLGDSRFLVQALTWQAAIGHYMGGDSETATSAYEQAVALARENGDKRSLMIALGGFADLHAFEGDFDRSFELSNAAIDLSRDMNDEVNFLNWQHNMACNLRLAGRFLEAKEVMRKHMAQQLRVWSPEFVVILAEDYGAVLAELGEFEQAARLFGAADAARKRHGTPRSPRQQTDIDGAFNTARSVLGSDVWFHEYQRGFNQAVEDALPQADSADRTDVATDT